MKSKIQRTPVSTTLSLWGGIDGGSFLKALSVFFMTLLVIVNGNQAKAMQYSDCELLGPKAHYASDSQKGNEHPRALDGDKATRWSTKFFPAKLTIDYGVEKMVCYAKINWYNGGVNGRVYGFSILGSKDGKNFDTVLYKGKSEPNVKYQVYKFSPQKVRYIRLVVENNSYNNWSSVNELMIYGKNSDSVFSHPGILLNQAQINKAKDEINQRTWRKKELDFVLSRTYNSRTLFTYRANPSKLLNSKSLHSKAREDALIAYSAALGWVYTGNERYAETAKQILNSYTNKDVSIDSDGSRGGNVQLQQAWLGEMMVPAAELIRHTNAKWPETEAKAFGQWAHNKLLKGIKDKGIDKGWYDPGNWTSSMANATINIGIYNDDLETFKKGVRIWRRTAQTAIYLNDDGERPIKFLNLYNNQAWNNHDKWWGTKGFDYDGIVVETCRDLGHALMELSSLTNALQTVYLQSERRKNELLSEYSGNDYPERFEERLFYAHEFLATLALTFSDSTQEQTKSLQGSEFEGLCSSGNITAQYKPTWEVGYAIFHGYHGNEMPNTKKILSLIRQQTPTRANRADDLHNGWPLLTHGVSNLN